MISSVIWNSEVRNSALLPQHFKNLKTTSVELQSWSIYVFTTWNGLNLIRMSIFFNLVQSKLIQIEIDNSDEKWKKSRETAKSTTEKGKSCSKFSTAQVLQMDCAYFFPSCEKTRSTHRATQAESQWIVRQCPLSHLQYLDESKSSTKDVSHPQCEIAIDAPAVEWRRTLVCNWGEPYFFSCHKGCGGQHCISSMDSDLEAFSHYPTHGSFAALAFQPAAFTKYVNELFLSY